MNPLFSKASLMLLESLSFTKTLYAFDFDGTLSKIVRIPSEASISPTTEALLKTLSSLAPVAIVSGRSVRDLRSRIGFEPQYVIGNHGLEGLGNNTESLKKAKSICIQWKKTLSEVDFGPGTEIEDKIYSLAIHYRRSRNKKQVKDLINKVLQTLKPAVQIITGKSVINLLPQGAPHKGAAVLELKKRAEAKHLFYIGDDDTDEDVFSLPDPQIMSVRVGKKRASQAHFYISRQSEINHLLKLLIRYHERGQTP